MRYFMVAICGAAASYFFALYLSADRNCVTDFFTGAIQCTRPSLWPLALGTLFALLAAGLTVEGLLLQRRKP